MFIEEERGMGRVEGKVALVTGAARGQGRSHAIRLAEEGADIIAIDICAQIRSVPYAMSTDADLAETAKLVEALDRRIVTAKVDVRDLAQVSRAVEEGTALLGPVDIVVANAGIMTICRTWEMSPELWQDMLDVNLTGVYNAARAVIPAMVERGAGGVIIMTSSAMGIRTMPNLVHYAAAKTGVVGMMKSLAQELGPYNIRVNTIHPSSVDTDMLQNQVVYDLCRPDLEHPSREDFAAGFVSQHLLPQPWVSPRDISNAVLFLASDEGKYVTAQQLKVDLGFCER
jgi:SDR family mycofactocin-dependent oxidoreductase